MNGDILDDFEDLSGWTAIASGQARLDLARSRAGREAPCAWISISTAAAASWSRARPSP